MYVLRPKGKMKMYALRPKKRSNVCTHWGRKKWISFVSLFLCWLGSITHLWSLHVQTCVQGTSKWTERRMSISWTPFFSTEKKGEITEEQLLEGRMNRLNGGEYISQHKKRMPGEGKKFAHEWLDSVTNRLKRVAQFRFNCRIFLSVITLSNIPFLKFMCARTVLRLQMH